tara:strand:+ start:18187 stop:18498 length:312 start_codon:yes stop_codon:yes gene_type:complete
MSKDVRNTLRRIIHSCYGGKIDAGVCLNQLYKEIDDDENWGGDEVMENEDFDSDLDGEEEEGEGESGGFFDAVIDILGGDEESGPDDEGGLLDFFADLFGDGE